MVLPDPSWRVKTRPCPFYQQGRCMFSESCNFLHTVSSQVDSEVKGVQEASGSSSPHNPPRVVINSPASICSSPRSPRTTGLLLALGDVVADPSSDEHDDQTELRLSSAEPDSWAESLPTLVNELGFGQYSQQNEESVEEHFVSYEDSDIDSDANWTAISDYDEDNMALQPPQEFMVESTDEPVHTSLTSPRQETRRANWVPSPDHDIVEFSHRHSLASTASLLSPIEVSTLRLSPFFQSHRSSERESTSFDSGYAENWKPPMPLLSSPPRSPSVSSTFDLLSSPFGAHSSRISSPHLGAFMPRSPVSPARTVSPNDTNDIEPLDLGLDSPQGHDDSTTYLTPLGSPSAMSQIQGLEEDSDSSSDDEQKSDATHSARGDELEASGRTSVWESEDGDTAVYLGNVHEDSVQCDVDSAVSRIDTTPTDFLNATVEFEVGEEAAHSSIPEIDNSSLINDADDDDDDASTSAEALPTSPDDETAYLAYLKSPLAAESSENDTTENDTLDSLYSSYSALSFDRSPPSQPSNLAQVPPSPAQPTSSVQSTSSTPLSSLRERVFTPPPPTRKRSGTVTADSPNSSTSPITSIDSSKGRQSPFSDKNIGQRTRSQSPYSQEVEVSRKIPIGFRSTFALGRANRSSLITSRNNGKGVALSPLQTHSVVPVANSQESGSPTSASSLPKGLKPLRLSTIIDAKYPSRPNNHSRMHSPPSNSVYSFHSGNINRKSASSTSVTSTNSLSDNRLLSSARPSPLPLHIRNSIIPSEHSPTSPSSPFSKSLSNLDDPPQSAPVASWRRSINYSRPSSRLSEPIHELEDDDFDEDTGRFSRDLYGETIRRPIPDAPRTAPISHAPSLVQHPVYTIETPKPTLMFAIASDNIEQVRQVLASGESGPNESVGPQSALEFTLRNDKLTNKLEIVKALLAYGADPATATKAEVLPAAISTSEEQDAERPRSLMEEIDPATKYYLERADSIHTKRMSVLIHRSFFRPLTRVRYDLIGQDRALEQLFRVLSMHSRELAVSPMVVMLCGPSGHGKSLLARKFGALLEVPTHTVNMTTLRATHNLWESHSMSPYETPTTCTLAEFLTNNEGKRCVVVLDEIEKTEDPKTLWSLLMPWELGRCAFEAGKRHVDVKNVIWLGTSNVGHDLVFQHRDARKDREGLMSREEYVELMALLRPKVSERLGASILSRITTVLPFVPFTLEEKRAICSEALHTLGGELVRTLAPETIQTVIEGALAEYCEDEGARSLHRAISNKLVDII